MNTINNTAQVSGASVRIFMEAMGKVKEMALGILQKHNIDTNVPMESWVDLNKWINALKEIEQRFGPATMFNIGKTVPSVIAFPPQVNSFESAMNGLNYSYLLTHRGIPNSDKYYKFRMTGQKSAIMECDNPYPSDFDRGLLSGMTRKFPPAGVVGMVDVKLDESVPSRKTSGKSCVFKMSWK